MEEKEVGIKAEQVDQLIRGERPFEINEDGEKVWMRWEEFKAKRRWAKLVVKEKLKGNWVHKTIEYKEEEIDGYKKMVKAHYGTYIKKNHIDKDDPIKEIPKTNTDVD